MAKYEIPIHHYQQYILDLIAGMKTEEYTAVIGIGRGGFIPAIYISHYFTIPMSSVFVSSYGENNEQQKLFVSRFNYVEFNTDNILIVDDITDSGKTLTEVKKQVEEEFKVSAKTATLFLKKGSIIKPDYFMREVPSDDWVIFPYEKYKKKAWIQH